MPINKEADINTEMSEADDTKKDPSTDVGVGDADSTNQEASKTEPEKEPEQETPDVTNDTQEHAQTDDKIESEPTAEKIEEQKANKDITPVVSGKLLFVLLCSLLHDYGISKHISTVLKGSCS